MEMMRPGCSGKRCFQISLAQVFYIGKHKENQNDRKEQGNQCQQNGFTQKLNTQLESLCADGFADAHFLGSFCRAGRREVHEINTGDGQHDQAR